MLSEAKELHSSNLPELLSRLKCSVVFSTYQAGQLISLGQCNGALSFGFTSFQQAMGVTRTPTGLALASKHEIWQLPGQTEIAAHIKPQGSHDIAFLTRSCHITGPVMAHELAWCSGQLLFVNTLCNCLATLESPWSFVPGWKPPFMETTAPGDCCHLNGVAIAGDGSEPAYVTMHGISSKEAGWREHKASGGAVMDVKTGEVLCNGLSMPHSPRLHRGELYVLNSGKGQVLKVDRGNGEIEVVCELPGFTRGMDMIGDTAVIGLSRIRESAVFGGLPLQEKDEPLCCGLAFVDLSKGELIGFCWFESGIEELFSVCLIPGFSNPAIIGMKAKANENDKDESRQTIWAIPPP
ncbi:TIGR03032 family protein [Synechococcus sp. AH-603-M21]|nr:TIGR03032 family protein [Synechococcus sp. AH-603-M21]